MSTHRRITFASVRSVLSFARSRLPSASVPLWQSMQCVWRNGRSCFWNIESSEAIVGLLTARQIATTVNAAAQGAEYFHGNCRRGGPANGSTGFMWPFLSRTKLNTRFNDLLCVTASHFRQRARIRRALAVGRRCACCILSWIGSH